MKLWPGIHIGFGITFAYASGAHPDSLSFKLSRIRYNNCWSYWWWRFCITAPAKVIYEELK